MFYLLATVLFSLLVALFAMQNAIPVSVNLGPWGVEASLAMVVIGSAAVGIAAALPIWIMMQLQLRYRLMKANSRVKELESELEKAKKSHQTESPKPKQDTVESAPKPVGPETK